MAIHIRRREFIVTLGGAAAGPLTARAQNQRRGRPIIGFMGSTTATDLGQLVAVFVQRLRELRWVDGQTVTIEYRWGEGRAERYSEIAAEFVRRKVDLIVTNSTPAVLAAKHATSEIPIVFPTAGDPIAAGIVDGLVHPGGNITGLGFQTIDTAGKRVQLLLQVIPDLRQLAVLGNPGDPASAAEMLAAGAAAKTLGLEIQTIGIRQAEEIAPAFDSFTGRSDGLYVSTSPPFGSSRKLIADLALSARLPTVHSIRQYVEAGGLLFYGASLPELWRRAAEMVDKILRGAKPADIPVELPTRFELVINLTTAKALGLTIPASLLSLAGELID
jgi:putative tryptophan/tyrosine transport system substrate-binding protein